MVRKRGEGGWCPSVGGAGSAGGGNTRMAC